MKKILSLLLLFAALATQAQNGLLKESLKVKSATLGKDVEYSIYLPADYDKSNRQYPVLYLLHGYSDDETGWSQFGEAQIIADKLQGEIAPMIIVMPDAGVSWYINSFDGKVKYEDFFIKEFIPFIDANYRTRPVKQYRAIAGLSMGGYGTLIMSTKHPELFSSAAPLSSGVFTDDEIANGDERMWKDVMGDLYGKKDLTGKSRLTEHYYKNSPLKIIETGNADELKKVRYYIDCGDKDFLIKGNMALHSVMIDKKIPHEFRVREGMHNWTYWRTALPDVLKFVSVSFHQQ
ncbi:alpha/beta hydrolase [Chryseolinea lacunae]|uniref:Esterase family protein n=1 Tax=Chryseolinea lacunae TaxID=2801331 RepID=A0ABS1KU21_9BACT|nr:alpha/beta hydrolase-fold protein [Chryseolinea lacunae]MBL0742949.1 esterase family protein [Chryseolinea lacunae]